jgi:hypothetical protein
MSNEYTNNILVLLANSQFFLKKKVFLALLENNKAAGINEY